MAGDESSAPGTERRPVRLRDRVARRRVRHPAVLRDLLRGRALRFTSGNRVEVFDNGADGLAAMTRAIEGARQSVHLETYILRSDETGRALLAALEARARSGAEVRLLYDSLGSRALDRRALVPLRRAGGAVEEFNPMIRWLPELAPRRRDHRKILVVDGRIAFVGGLNVGNEYAERRGGWPDGEPEWRDAHLSIEGPAVPDLEVVFLEGWWRARGNGSDGEAGAAPLPATEPATARVGSVRCAVLADGPHYHRRRMRELVVSALDEAESRVLLVSPYFAPGRRVLAALEQAGERGVTVDLLLAGRTDHPLLRRGARSFVPRLAARGVRVFEDDQRMMHAKVAVFDDDFAIVGTSNLDRQSLEHSYEVNVVMEGEGVPAEIRQRFTPDPSCATPVDLALLAQRGPFERWVDWLCALLLRLV
jgi:cardiolipin synthase